MSLKRRLEVSEQNNSLIMQPEPISLIPLLHIQFFKGIENQARKLFDTNRASYFLGEYFFN